MFECRRVEPNRYNVLGLGLVLAMLVGLVSAAAQAMPQRDMFGSWQGEADGDVVRLDLKRSGDGFSLALAGGPALDETEFFPGPSATVYEGERRSGIVDWFRFTEKPPPHPGRPLLWARADAGGMTVTFYRFEMAASGDFDLHRLALELVDGQLMVRHVVRSEQGEQRRWQVVLNRT